MGEIRKKYQTDVKLNENVVQKKKFHVKIMENLQNKKKMRSAKNV